MTAGNGPTGRMTVSDTRHPSDEVAERIRAVRFATVLMKDGYVMGPVDELLEQLEASARYGLPVDKLLESPRLPRSRFREGYAVDEVDAFLADVRRILSGANDSAPPAPAPPTDTGHGSGGGLADWVRSTSFTQVRLREGYDIDEVDALMTRLAEVADAGGDLAAAADGVSLTRVRLRDGYDLEEVDRFLEDARGASPDAPAVGREQTSSAVVERIRNVVFTQVRLRDGYDTAEVDAFLDDAVAAASAGRPLAPLVAGARFTQVRLREGYDMVEVDDFLAGLADD